MWGTPLAVRWMDAVRAGWSALPPGAAHADSNSASDSADNGVAADEGRGVVAVAQANGSMGRFQVIVAPPL